MFNLHFSLKTSLFKSFAILLTLPLCKSTVTAQQVDLKLFNSYVVEVNAGPTICEASSASISSHIGWFWYPETPADLPTDIGSYHIAEAGKTSIITVDIPAVGNLPGLNIPLTYFYSIPGGIKVHAQVSPSSNAPSGMVRFEIPVTFDVGAEKAFLQFQVRDLLGVSDIVTVPITVLGPTTKEVPILGTTVDPQVPYMVLHAPPGDGSSSSFAKGTRTCRKLESTYAESGSASANLAVKLGVAGSAGFIVTTDFEFSVTFSGGVTAGDLAISSTAEETCVTVNENFMTSALTGPDGGGDVYIGYGTDLAYGVYPYRSLDQANCRTYLDTSLIYLPTGEPRKFIYTKEAILSDIETQQAIVDDVSAATRARNTSQNQIDVWNQVLAMNDENVNSANNEILGSTSFSGGTTSSNETSITVTETNAIKYEHFIEGSVGIKTVVEVGGSGVTGGFEYKSSKRYGSTQNQSDQMSKLVKYTLADANEGDIFNVQVERDPMYGTPIFRVQDGSRSSCPYQGGYQRDQPLLKHDGSEDIHLLIEDQPILSSATFKVDLCNNSNEDRTYNLKLNALSNLNGAVVSAAGVPLNGNDLGQSFEVAAGSCVEDLIVEVKMQSETSPLEYSNLEIFLYSPCEPGIQSSVFATVNFEQSTSTEELHSTLSSMNCYPNPVTDILHVDFHTKTSESVELLLTDMMGRVITTKRIGQLQEGLHQYMIDASTLSKGMYTVTVRTAQGMKSKRIAVR